MKRRIIIDLAFDLQGSDPAAIDHLLDMAVTGLEAHGLFTITTDAKLTACSFRIHPQTAAPRFPVGTQYISRGMKRKDLCTVIDYHVTTNLAGEIVGRRYVSTHDFLGQAIKQQDIETTIARNLASPSL